MRRNALLALSLSLTLGAAAGCSSVRPFTTSSVSQDQDQEGDFSYIAGRASRTFPSSPAALQPAVLGALEDLRFGAARQWTENSALVMESKTADNRKLIVNLRPQPGGSTRMTARVGVFGDEPLSRALVDRVAIRLGTLPPTAIPVDPPSSPGSNPYFSREAVPDALMFKDKADAPFKGSDAP